ncbi:MAG: hypothetical protein QOJ09_2430 [Actinomycetota bacterium]|jgi:hypothetical protein|nr:hypothetical protein [Actinomycetota bacterium]
MRRRVLLACAVALVVGAMAAPAVLAGNDYSDQAYAEHDRDNVTRSAGRHMADLTRPEWHDATRTATAESYLSALGLQLADIPNGRLHTGLGQWIPGGSVGDPETWNSLPYRRVQFLSRTGAKLSGHIWGSEAPGPRPGIVFTTGSIQATEGMYHWLAQILARAGYEVFTFDVQGQGESEGFGHAPGDKTPTFDGVPAQQQPNFVDGTIDALRFFTSTPDHPYRPVGWTEADAAAAAAGRGNTEQIDLSNPGFASLDRSQIGIAGHSLGATAVSVVQQCSDEGTAWQTVADCHGQAYPIRAVIGFDALTSDVTPVVPGMNQQADGYFLNPTPSSQAPDRASHLAAHKKWVAAGLDTYSFTVRGGTHLEWSYIPLISMATAYGRHQIGYYTLNWFDRWLAPTQPARDQALTNLLDGPKAEGIATEAPWRANDMSARYLGAFSLSGQTVVDLRAYGGTSPVGDWAGANADRQGRVLP